MKAINIKWDVEFLEDLKTLPAEIEIPDWMTDEDEISDYITDATGYCHMGFDIVETESEKIIPATFTSVWDGGYAVTTDCKVNMETHEVFDIEIITPEEQLEVLDCEYITINGENYPVINSDDEDIDENETVYWYN